MNSESVAGQPERLSLLAANVKKDSGYREKLAPGAMEICANRAEKARGESDTWGEYSALENRFP